jgi:hypothetical protein
MCVCVCGMPAFAHHSPWHQHAHAHARMHARTMHVSPLPPSRWQEWLAEPDAARDHPGCRARHEYTPRRGKRKAMTAGARAHAHARALGQLAGSLAVCVRRARLCVLRTTRSHRRAQRAPQQRHHTHKHTHARTHAHTQTHTHTLTGLGDGAQSTSCSIPLRVSRGSQRAIGSQMGATPLGAPRACVCVCVGGCVVCAGGTPRALLSCLPRPQPPQLQPPTNTPSPQTHTRTHSHSHTHTHLPQALSGTTRTPTPPFSPSCSRSPSLRHGEALLAGAGACACVCLHTGRDNGRTQRGPRRAIAGTHPVQHTHTHTHTPTHTHTQTRPCHSTRTRARTQAAAH